MLTPKRTIVKRQTLQLQSPLWGAIIIYMEKQGKTKANKAALAAELIAFAIVAAALALFGYWAFTKKDLTVQGLVAATLSIGIFTMALVLAIPAAFRFFRGETEGKGVSLGERSGKKSGAANFLRIMLTIFIVRVGILVLAYLIGRAFRGYQRSFISTLENIWLKLDTDAPHYLDIAENGYVTSGQHMYSIVFLPLFPALIKCFNYLFGNSFVSALVINTFCSCTAGGVMYELALCDMGRRSARNTVVFTFAMPAAIFFIAPMSEALFLLLSALTLLFVRKGKFWLAAVFGALASFTRSVGIIMIIPFVAEAIVYAVSIKREKGGRALAWTVVKLVCCCLILLAGTFGYLLINKLVWGDWFKFMEFQRDVWYQQFGSFFDTAATQTDQLFLTLGTENDAALGLWLPNLLFVFGALLVLVFSARTLRTSYTLYFAAYFALTCSATWLLSAPRYLTVLTALPLALAHLCDSRDDSSMTGRAKAKAAAVTTVLCVGQAFYLLMYILDYCIY